MKKSELIDRVSLASTASKTLVAQVLAEFVAITSRELSAGGEVALPGLGSFKTTKREARTGRNPITGEKLKIPAKTVPKFTAAAALKSAVAGSKKKGARK